MSDEKGMVQSIMDHPKTAVAVPIATAAASQLTLIAQVQSVLTLVSIALGVLVSCVLLMKHVLEIKKLAKEIKAEDHARN